MYSANLSGLRFLYLLIIVISLSCSSKRDSSTKGSTELSDSLVYDQMIKVDSLNIMFLGDILCYESQMRSAFDTSSRKHNFSDVFEKVKPLLLESDFTIANLEVTLSGEPYKGYPNFSSPDELVMACKESGINVLTTANNHCCDYGKDGLYRTIDILDSLSIKHTGTFKDFIDMRKNNLLVLQKNNIKVGVLNYTYGTNGRTVPKPAMVNIIDTVKILKDIERTRIVGLDKLIVSVHWGDEYQSELSSNQVKLASFLFKNGVDIIVGSHPHVLQPMEFHYADSLNSERMIAYSLGNFVSNQRKRKTDGGAILNVILTKSNNECRIESAGYHLTWVNKPYINGKVKFEVLPCSLYEIDPDSLINLQAQKKMNVFISDSRTLFEVKNLNIEEINAVLE